MSSGHFFASFSLIFSFGRMFRWLFYEKVWQGGFICDFGAEMDTRHILQDIVFFNCCDGGHTGVRDERKGSESRGGMAEM